MQDCKRNNNESMSPTKKITLKRTQIHMSTDATRDEEAKKTKIN